MTESIIKSSRINPLYRDTVAKFDLKQPNGFYQSYEAVFTPKSRKYIKLGDGSRTDDQIITDEDRLKILEESVAPKIVEQAQYPLWYRAFKGIKNIITKKEFGGTMNYAQYLQDGGEAPMSDEQALELQKQKDAELIETIKQNPDSLPKMIEEYGEDAPSFVKHIVDLATENQDRDLAELIAPFAEQLNIFKCGGKVRAKVKKACGGKKLEKGAKVPMAKKGICPCQLKRVGGRLIEVDCNGIPVAKNGAVLYARDGDVVKNYMTEKQYSPSEVIGTIGSVIPGYNLFVRNDVDGKIVSGWNKFVNRMNRWERGLQQADSDFWGTPASVKKEVAANQPAVESPEWLAQQRKNQEVYLQTPEGQAAVAKADEEIAKKQAAAEAERRAQEVAARRNAFGAGKQGTFGGLTYDEALKRQREMQAAKAQGFNVDLGRWGADGKWGRQSSGEWERYQKWKADQTAAQELANMKAENTNLTKLVEPQKKYFFAGSEDLLNVPASKVEVTVPSVNKFIAANVGDSNIRLASKYLQSGGKMTYADYLK